MKPKTDQEIELMRQGGQKLATILKYLAGETKPGKTPKEISALAAREIKKYGLTAVLLGYEGFSDVICISVNNAIVHGMPSTTPLAEGDVVKLDLTVGNKGLIVDSAITLIAGNKQPDSDVKRLLEGTKKALDAGISAIKGSGTRVGDISAAVQKVLDQNQLGIIRDLVGHGIGYSIHEAPNIPNYGIPATGPLLSAGATICIEPMAALGDWHISVAPDKWTIVMADGSLGAHFEHTVLVTETGAEILTQA